MRVSPEAVSPVIRCYEIFLWQESCSDRIRHVTKLSKKVLPLCLLGSQLFCVNHFDCLTIPDISLFAATEAAANRQHLKTVVGLSSRLRGTTGIERYGWYSYATSSFWQPD